MIGFNCFANEFDVLGTWSFTLIGEISTVVDNVEYQSDVYVASKIEDVVLDKDPFTFLQDGEGYLGEVSNPFPFLWEEDPDKEDEEIGYILSIGPEKVPIRFFRLAENRCLVFWHAVQLVNDTLLRVSTLTFFAEKQ